MLIAMKRDGNKEGNDDGDEGGVQQKGNGNGGKSNGDGIRGGGQLTAMGATTTRVVAEQWQQGP